ncbi:MAG: hypothetical protein ABGX16_01950, partial [Pirellulales bacterium]
MELKKIVLRKACDCVQWSTDQPNAIQCAGRKGFISVGAVCQRSFQLFVFVMVRAQSSLRRSALSALEYPS